MITTNFRVASRLEPLQWFVNVWIHVDAISEKFNITHMYIYFFL